MPNMTGSNFGGRAPRIGKYKWQTRQKNGAGDPGSQGSARSDKTPEPQEPTLISTPRSLTATEKVLERPELVSAIFQELAKPIRHVWRDIPDVRHVLALIGGPLLAGHIRKWREAAPRITFPTEIRQSQLTRFNLYNQHVRALEVFGDPDKPILRAGLESIGLPLSRTGPSNVGSTSAPNPIVEVKLPLLPKLRVLEATRHNAGAAKSTSHEIYQWIRLFSSETCTTIRVAGAPYLRGCWMNGPDTADTFHILTQRYANLECLELFSKPSRFSLEDVVAFDPALLTQIAGFLNHSLRLATLSLGCDAISLCVFAALVGVPSLKTLKFRYHRGAGLVVNNISVPEPGFHSLTRLELYDIKTESLRDLLSIRCLFQNLQTLVVDFDILTLPDEPDEIVRLVFQEIVEAAPQLRDLELFFPLTTSPNTRLLPATIEILTELDLLCLRFQCVAIHGAEGFTRFHDKWPSLQVLLWIDQPVTTEDLAMFAQRAPLKNLAISLSGAQPAPPQSMNAAPINAGPLRLQSDFPLHNFNSDDLENYARYLRNCWGGVALEMANRSTPGFDCPSAANPSCFRVMQNHLRRLSED